MLDDTAVFKASSGKHQRGYELRRSRCIHHDVVDPDDSGAVHREGQGAAVAVVNADMDGATLAALRAPVDAFFDGVMVNADDPALRTNRLGLLASLHAAMNRVADLSRLAV